MDKIVTKKSSNKQNLASTAIHSEYPGCSINGKEATRISKGFEIVK
jgi:hypothetical protein